MNYSPSSYLFGVPIYRWLALATLVIALITVSITIRQQLNIEWSLESLRAYVLSLGMWGPVTFIGILVFRFLFLIPSSLLLLAAGLLFGPAYGTLYAGLGLFGSALWKFALVSVVGQDFLVSRLPRQAQARLAMAVKRKTSAWVLAGITSYPFLPKHIFQFAAILSGIPLTAYVAAALVGSFARAGIFATIGEAIYTGTGIVTTSLILILLLLLPICVPSWRRWLLRPTT